MHGPVPGFYCMFLLKLQWQRPLYQRQIMCGCFVGLAPFVLLFCFSGDETQVWLGDLRVVLFCGGGFFCGLISLCTGQLCYVPFLTAYVSFRTVPLCIYGQSRGKKKVWTSAGDPLKAAHNQRGDLYPSVAYPYRYSLVMEQGKNPLLV